MSKNNIYAEKIEQNKKNFDFLLRNISNENEEKLNINIAQYALTYATDNCCGIFYSRKLENFFTDLGRKYSCPVSEEYDSNTYLHVMTTTYLVGGHTRVVERWIKDADENQRHSVILIKQEGEIPLTLKDNIKQKNGELYLIENGKNLIDKALTLRKIASKYEYVILHTHMDDPTATVAFSHESFHRPVIFFNHADHIFWIGKNVADIIADINIKKSITETRRNIKNRLKLPIPVENKKKIIKDKVQSRKKLGISPDAKVIVTSGSAYKYKRVFNDTKFYDLIEKILKKIDKVNVFVIGPNKHDQHWSEIKTKYNGKIWVLGTLPYDKGYTDYLSAADLCLDSYPFNGYTTCLDAIAFNLPLISLDRAWSGSDFISNLPGCINTIDEAVDTIEKILNNGNYREEFIKEEKLVYNQEFSLKKWKDCLSEIIKNVNLHQVKYCIEDEPFFVDQYCMLLNEVVGKSGNVPFFKYKNKICVEERDFLFFLKKRRYVTESGMQKSLSVCGVDVVYNYK